MSGIALFAPDEECRAMAVRLLEARSGHHVRLVKCIRTAQSIEEAKNAVSQGMNVIIARGDQAHFIRENTNVPLAEICLTAQELGLLIRKAKTLLGKEFLRVGLFGHRSMFCDTSHFDELFGIELHTYIVKDTLDWTRYIAAAQADRCDVILGGRILRQFDDLSSIPYLYASGTEESLSAAIDEAEALYSSALKEQRGQAQFSAILYSATNGIIQISPSGNVLLLNRVMEDLLGVMSPNVLGTPVQNLLPGLDMGKIEDVLSGNAENYSGFVPYQKQKLLVVAEPIVVDDQNSGAILSCTNLTRIDGQEQESTREQMLKGNPASATFDAMKEMFPDLAPVLERARIYALSPSPMLIEAISGPELEMLTQSIHNHSIRRGGPFVMVGLAGLTGEQQAKVLFGDPKSGEGGALLEAHHGTLVIQGIDKLTLPLQYQLVRIIRLKRMDSGSFSGPPRLVDIRLIATTAKNLSRLRQQFLFRTDLLFMLKALRVRIPCLKDRPRDIEHMLDIYMKEFSRQYARYHVLSDGARQTLLSYPWEGNVIQLQAFCERMILTVNRRVISEEYVKGLLEEIYQQDSGIYDRKDELSFETEDASYLLSSEPPDPVRAMLESTLRENNGNRKKTAQALHMSTTTLWRKMKAYGIE